MRTELETTLLHCRNLPSPPGVALQIISLAQDPNATLGAAAQIINLDPALSARLLRLANSPLYATRRRVESLSQAMAMLGLNATLSLALGFSLIQGLRSANSAAKLQEHIWQRSVLSALAARLMGQQLGLKRPEALMLAGLLQDIGRLALLQAIPAEYAALSEKAEGEAHLTQLEESELGSNHATVGAWLARRWRLPDYLIEATDKSEDEQCSEDSFYRCIQASGAIADLWLATAETADAARERALEKMGLDAPLLDVLLPMIAAALPEVSATFDIQVTHPAHLQALSEEARELLILRNLQQVQDAQHARQLAQSAEDRLKLLSEQSRRDPLTGVFNRRHMDEVLEREFNSNTSTALTVALLDLDNFKHINDRYGHLIGDQVLRQFAQIVLRTLRTTDVVARYGGEEFLLVLNYADKASSLQVLQRLMNEVSKTPMALVDNQPVFITFSAGFASADGADGRFTSVEALLQAADDALYRSKREGRNQIHSHEA